jgi:hypothetical protein
VEQLNISEIAQELINKLEGNMKDIQLRIDGVVLLFEAIKKRIEKAGNTSVSTGGSRSE